jgi:DNA-directed RNA polymerase specialized sigma24 family protein
VRLQGLTHAEAAAILGVATKTVQRRLNRSLCLLADALGTSPRGLEGATLGS